MKTATVKIGSESRTFHFEHKEHSWGFGSWISAESYVVKYRTGKKDHVRKVVVSTQYGCPVEFNHTTKRFEKIEWPEIISIGVETIVQYGNRNSIEYPAFFVEAK